MAYTITKTNGDTLTTIPDTELNRDYGLTLVGRNYAGYGIYLNDNFISLMENFAKDTAPATPLEGQLWWNTSEMSLQVWEGSVWKKLSFLTTNSVAPSATGRTVGDLWWDTANQQLKAWAGEVTSNVLAQYSTTSYIVALASTDNVRIGDILTTGNVLSANAVTVTQILSSGNVRINTPATIYATETVRFTRNSGWNVIGPGYTKDQQITGIYPRTITDVNGTVRTLGLIYQKGQIVGTISRDNEYTPRDADAIERLPIIKPGITLIETAGPQYVKSVAANAAGAGGTTVVTLSSTSDLAVGDIVIAANIAYSANKTIQEIYANNAIRVNVTDFFTENEVLTFQRGSDESVLFHGTATDAQRLNGKTSDLFATLSTEQWFRDNLAVEGNIYLGANSTPAVNKTVFWQQNANLNITNTQNLGNINLSTRISGIANPVTVLSISGLTGLSSVRGDPTTANGIATKNYVDTTSGVVLGALSANIDAIINNAPVSKRDFGNVATILTSFENTFVTVNATLDAKADVDSPALTGTPTAPTAAFGSNSTAIATTAFATNLISYTSSLINANIAAANSQISLRATINSPAFTGVPTAPTPASNTNTTQIATTAFVQDLLETATSDISGSVSGKAPINSPTFTGSPAAPTQTSTDSSTKLATTAFVQAQKVAPAFTGIPTAPTAAAGTNTTQLATTAFVQGEKASPVFTGVPTAPTAAAGTNTNQLATTRFVNESSPVLSVNGKNGAITLGVADITGAAPINNPAFTGTPTLTTIPIAGDDSAAIPSTSWVKDITDLLAPMSSPTFIGTVTVPNPSSSSDTTVAATTSWVRARIASADVPKWGGSTKYISQNEPGTGDGANGDIWFKYL
jgi:hypothetical protein